MSLTFANQQARLLELLGDPNGTSNLWPLALRKSLLNEGCDQSAIWLPRQSTPILDVEKTVNSTNATYIYPIDDAPFSLTDFHEAIDFQIKYLAADSLVSASFTTKEAWATDNPFFAGTKYQPLAMIAANPSDSAERAIFVHPTPDETVTNGMRLIYRALVNTLSGNDDLSVLPGEFHELPVYHAAAVLSAKAGRRVDADRYWGLFLSGINEQRLYYGLPELDTGVPKGK